MKGKLAMQYTVIIDEQTQKIKNVCNAMTL